MSFTEMHFQPISCQYPSRKHTTSYQRESDMEVDQGWHPWDLVKYKGDTTLTFRLRFSKQLFPLDLGQMSLTQRCTSSQYHANNYHANIPVQVESIPGIPHHTTQNEFMSKRNSPTSLTVNKNWKLEVRRMSMSKRQNLSKSWRQRHHEQLLGIPGHNRPSLPQRRWNCIPSWCLSQKCSSSKLRLVPGRRESDLEVDQGWHLWDLMKYKWDTTLSFRLWVSKQQFPLDSGQMSLTQRCTSSQYHANNYHANIPVQVESIPGIPHHTTQNEFKSKRNSPTSLTVNKIWNLEMRRISISKLQSLPKSWRQRHHEQPLGIPGHKRPSLPHRPAQNQLTATWPANQGQELEAPNRAREPFSKHDLWQTGVETVTKKPWKPPTPQHMPRQHLLIRHPWPPCKRSHIQICPGPVIQENTHKFSNNTECARKKWSHTVKYLT